MYPDFKELLEEFNAHQVKYLIVGGYAVSLHGEPRATKDLDIFIRADSENARAAFSALAKFGAPIQGMNAQDLAEPGSFFRMGTPPVMVDILPTIRGVDFDQAWQRRVEVTVDEQLVVPIISREDLLSSKLAAGRAQDLADVETLERFQTLPEEGQRTSSASDAFSKIEEMQRRSAELWLERSNRGDYNTDSPDAAPRRGRDNELSPEDDSEI